MGRLTVSSLFWCLCCIYIHKSLGSEVHLTATPERISDGLTDRLRLRCSVQDTVGVSGVIVGRQASSTNYDIEHVNSIIIARASPNETMIPVAQIIISENAKVFDSSQSLTADGTLTPSDPADTEYLELTWTNPGEDQSGSYTCEINGLDLQGHGVMLQNSVNVDFVVPEVEDLVSELKDVKSTINILYSKIEDLKAIVATHKAPHVEEGIAECGDSNGWTPLNDKDQQKESVVDITFQQPYTSPPVVSIASVGGDIESNTNERYHWRVNNVTTTGFQIICSTWATTHFLEMKIGWTSFVA